MKEFIIEQLLETTDTDDFQILLGKHKISSDVWRENKELLEHYEYLESLIPEELKLSNPIRYEFRKHSD